MGNSRIGVALLGSAWSLFASASVAASESQKPALDGQQPPDALVATVGSVRDAGTLLISWVLDQASSDTTSETTDSVAGAQPEQVRWSSCPGIGFDEARKLVDSRWTGKFKPTDGWGHALQFCLRRDDLGAARYVVGVRSPGRDGQFESDTYTTGAFATTEPDRDVVWLDGVFVTWPEATPASE